MTSRASGYARRAMTALSRRRSRTTEIPQGATYVELFFDLVFVYAVTQVTSLLVHDLTWLGAAGRRWSPGWCGGPGSSSPGR